MAFKVPGSAGSAGLEPSILGLSVLESYDEGMGTCRLDRLLSDLEIVL